MSDLTCLASVSLFGFIVSTALVPPYIQWLKIRDIGQFVRQEGPSSHNVKVKTPTMGGICFIAAFVLASIVSSMLVRQFSYVAWSVILCSLASGAIGFTDDLSKVKRKANAGLSAPLRLLLEGTLGSLFALSMWFLQSGSYPTVLVKGFKSAIYFPENHTFWFMLVYILFVAFVVCATTNAVNLHDGLDGLACGTTVQVLAVLGIMLFATHQVALACIASCGVGAVLGFLIFNFYPAKIFMGDTGSLFLGGLIACLAIAGHLMAWFVPLSIIYIDETLSVIYQVTYFKLTKDYKPAHPMSCVAIVWHKLTKRLPGEGKRLFRMAPLHHHFESIALERGGKEWHVTTLFWLAQFIVSVLVVMAFWLI